MELLDKLAILANAAKYDASCASSGAEQRDSRKGGLGSTSRMGICHSYTPDGRCVSLLKVLLTNYCIYDCHYCINRKSSNIARARFKIEEIVQITLDFYKRNYIEGLFLSSGIIQSPDYTMEQLIAVARTLREQHQFRGYIHLKTIPDASPELIDLAGKYSDRLSINLELPNQESLDRLAPEKKIETTKAQMAHIHCRILEHHPPRKPNQRKTIPRSSSVPKPQFATSQSTQIIVGADASSDAEILTRASELYASFGLRRVYYSAFSPIPFASSLLPNSPPPLLREHRLYQADWLLRFYGFSTQEILPASSPHLDLELDPKLAWALRNPHIFPADINKVPREILLRIPGIGVRNSNRILIARKHHSLSLADLSRLKVNLQKAMPFIITNDYRPQTIHPERLRSRFLPKPKQLEFSFDQPPKPTAEDFEAAVIGEF